MQTNSDNNDQANRAVEADIEADVTSINIVQFDERKHRAEIAGKLAFRFTCIFAAALAVHYFIFLVLALAGKTASIEQLSDYLQIWFPALTGVVSAAAAYYFAKAE